MDDSLSLSLTMGVSTLLLAVICHTMAAMTEAGTLQRNGAMGIRTRATMQSDAAWERAHQVSVPNLRTAAIVGYLTPVLSLGLLFMPLIGLDGPATLAADIVTCAGFTGVMVLILIGGRRGHQAARELNRSASTSD